MEPGEVHSFLQKADNVAAGAARVALWLSGAGLGPGLTAVAAPLVDPPAIRRCLHAYTCRSVRLRLSRFSAPPSPFLSPASRLSLTASRLLSLLLFPKRTDTRAFPCLAPLHHCLAPPLPPPSPSPHGDAAPHCLAPLPSVVRLLPNSLPPVLRSLLFFAPSCSSPSPVLRSLLFAASSLVVLLPIPCCSPSRVRSLFPCSQPSISVAFFLIPSPPFQQQHPVLSPPSERVTACCFVLHAPSPYVSSPPTIPLRSVPLADERTTHGVLV